jgi:protein-tyrosine kinase
MSDPVLAEPIRPRGASVDPVAMARNLLLPGIEDVAVLRAFKILRTRVRQRLEARNGSVLGVTGTTAGEGKTLAAVNLALALAEDVNTAVFLVDLDLQRPKIAEYLGMSCREGITEYLSGTARMNDIVYDTGIGRLAVIPNTSPLSDSSEMLRSPQMAVLVHVLRRETPRRLIIFDLPPLLASDDVLAFAPLVDSFLFVVSQGQTARRSVSNAKELLAELDVLGIVLNRSTEHNDSRYY